MPPEPEPASGRGGGVRCLIDPLMDPGNNQHIPQYANYWAPLTRKRHTMPHSAQPQHTNYWAPRTRKRHQQEHRPQRLPERSDPTQRAKGRTGDCPGPRKGTTTRRNVTRGGGGGALRCLIAPLMDHWPASCAGGAARSTPAGHGPPSPHSGRFPRDTEGCGLCEGVLCLTPQVLVRGGHGPRDAASFSRSLLRPLRDCGTERAPLPTPSLCGWFASALGLGKGPLHFGSRTNGPECGSSGRSNDPPPPPLPLGAAPARAALPTAGSWPPTAGG